MIKTFRDAATERLWRRELVRKWVGIQRQALRRMTDLDAAITPEDLRRLGHRLHALQGDRAGCLALWIQGSWRLVFRWHNGNAYDVEIVDYHD